MDWAGIRVKLRSRMSDVRGRAPAKIRCTRCWYGERSGWKARWGCEQNTQFSADDIDGGAVRGRGREYRAERSEREKCVVLFALCRVCDPQADDSHQAELMTGANLRRRNFQGLQTTLISF